MFERVAQPLNPGDLLLIRFSFENVVTGRWFDEEKVGVFLGYTEMPAAEARSRHVMYGENDTRVWHMFIDGKHEALTLKSTRLFSDLVRVKCVVMGWWVVDIISKMAEAA